MKLDFLEKSYMKRDWETNPRVVLKKEKFSILLEQQSAFLCCLLLLYVQVENYQNMLKLRWWLLFLFALLHKWLTWISKWRLLSMLKLNKFSLLLLLNRWSPIWILAISALLTIKLEYLWLSLFIWLLLNHLKHFWDEK